MRRNVILLCDIIAFYIVFVWSVRGPWDRLLGFSVYHSRGDVWLPTPPAAAAYFRSIVSRGATMFAQCFLVTSLLLLYLGRPHGTSTDERRGILFDAFYGDTRNLIVKYSAFLVTSFISPFFYNFMWRFPLTHPYRVVGGFAISVGLFILILAIAELVARVAPSRRQVESV